MNTNIQSMHIGQVIREIREARKATLEEIAFAANTNASNLSRIERGTQGYSVESLARIASALDVTVSELHLRAESAGDDAEAGGRSNARGSSAEGWQVLANGYAALTPDNRDLVDDFMALLLRRQKLIKSSNL